MSSLIPRMSRRAVLRSAFVGLVAAASLSPVLAAPLQVKDARGRLISLPAPPRRIVSIAPSDTEILFALGLGSRIVGVTDYCDYPAQAKSKPKVGGVVLNYEKIVALKPDLIVAKYDLQKSAIDRLERLGKKVFAVNPQTVEGTLAAIERIGRVTGRLPQAKRITARMRKELAQAKKVAQSDKSSPKVLSIIQKSPLIVVGPGTFLNDAIRRAGGRNVAADAKGPYPTFSLESAVARKPDVILLSANKPAEILNDPAWRITPAAKRKRVYAPSFMAVLERPAPRLSAAVLKLARLLHGS